jgi:hypothetical protein
MAYRGDEIGIGAMLDELVANDRTEFDAAVELEDALKDGKIILWYAGAPVSDDLPAIGRFLRDFVSDRKQAALRYAYLRLMLADARASRSQFETACVLVEPANLEKAKKRGPAPGSVDRYGASDRARFPEIEALVKAGKTLTAATKELASTLEGPATEESKAKRLRDLYKKVKATN